MMSFATGSGTFPEPNLPDVLPLTSQTPSHANASVLAGELSMAADFIGWPRAPGLCEFEQMADLIVAAGYFGMEDPMDASTS